MDNPEKNLPGDGLWSDAAVAREAGVAVDVVTGLRGTHCYEAGDVIQVRGQPVFSPAGLEKIRAAIDAHMRGAKTKAAKVAAARSAACTLPTKDLRITRTFKGSPRVLAQLPNGNEIVLQVKTAALLEAGMVLVDCVKGEMGWYYHGRLPRVVGEKQLFFPPDSKPKRLPRE